MSRPRARTLLAFGLAFALGACAPANERRPGPYPEACAGYLLSQRRCDAVVVRALEDALLERSAVASIQLLNVPEQAPHFGQGVIAVVGFMLVGGGAARQEISCPGISGSYDPACGDEATISISAGVDRDIPCDAAGKCAVEPPRPPAAIVAAATPFRLDAIDIPIDHPGHYAIKLGTATLPNGYLTERSLSLVDAQPTSYWVFDGWLSVTSDVAGRPQVGSIFREPYDGLEPVTIRIEFDVRRYVEPGVLQLRDIVVR